MLSRSWHLRKAFSKVAFVTTMHWLVTKTRQTGAKVVTDVDHGREAFHIC